VQRKNTLLLVLLAEKQCGSGSYFQTYLREREREGERDGKEGEKDMWEEGVEIYERERERERERENFQREKGR
jgi:hypothetical protein